MADAHQSVSDYAHVEVREGTPVFIRWCSRCQKMEQHYVSSGMCVVCEKRRKEDAGQYVPTDTPAQMVVHGVECYTGKMCKKCGTNIHIAGTAFGTTKKGRCLKCALEKEKVREHGNLLKHFDTRVNAKVNKFIAQSIGRSSALEVCPRNSGEMMAVKMLARQAEVMNEIEKAAGAVGRWAMCHNVPAVGDGSSFVGVCRIENLFIGRADWNRKQGDLLPDDWMPEQVLSVQDATFIGTQAIAQREWTAFKKSHIYKQMTKSEKKAAEDWQEARMKAHRERVKSLGVNPHIIDALTADALGLDRVIAKMDGRIKTLKDEHLNKLVALLAERRNTGKWKHQADAFGAVDALNDGARRLFIVKQTIQQVQDGISIVEQRQGVNPDLADKITALRMAVAVWADEVLDCWGMTVPAFTHPILNELGDSWVWGTRTDTDTGAEYFEVFNVPKLADSVAVMADAEARKMMTEGESDTRTIDDLKAEISGETWSSDAAPLDVEVMKRLGVNPHLVNPVMLGEEGTGLTVKSFLTEWDDDGCPIAEKEKLRQYRLAQEERQQALIERLHSAQAVVSGLGVNPYPDDALFSAYRYDRTSEAQRLIAETWPKVAGHLDTLDVWVSLCEKAVKVLERIDDADEWDDGTPTGNPVTTDDYLTWIKCRQWK